MSPIRKPAVSVSELIVRPHHTAFSCRDWEGSMRFFVDIVGFKVLGEDHDRGEPELAEVVGMPGARCRWAMLEREGYHIELFQWLTPAGSAVNIRQCDIGYTHIAFQVRDAAEVQKRLVASGYQPVSRPIPVRGGRATAFYCHGPEGCIVEYPFGS